LPPTLSPAIVRLLRCPACRSPLRQGADHLQCPAHHCGIRFPVVGGVPVLLNEQRSLFRIQNVLGGDHPMMSTKGGGPRATVQRMMPNISANLSAPRNFAHIGRLLERQSSEPKVLIVGGGTLGEGIEALLGHPGIELVETDVALGPRVGLVCDAHDLPFADESLDCVIAQAVLEHVVDPHRCVEEMYRVLKPGAIVYAETPFMQQVHLGRFDFSRFTHLGHRRLFRRFEEIESGATGGPGMVLAWSYLYFLLSFSSSRFIRKLVRVFASLTAFHLKYFDHFLIKQAGAYDAASGYHFLGTKSIKVLDDQELIQLYRGAL